MIAHVGGLPIEELAPALTGAGASLLVARAWLALRLARHREGGSKPRRGTAPVEGLRRPSA